VIRREVLYRGHVQGVGFRLTTERLARPLGVTGFVRNMADGRVELVAEGERSEVERLLAAVDEQLGHYVREMKTDERPATGQFADFCIRY
jgi:acylphosphatase